MITVAISTYDRPDALSRALRFLYASSRPPEETIVIDQSRDDRGRELVQSIGDSARFLHQRPPSIAAARNLAVELARGDYVAIIDDDCEVSAEWLEAVESELERLGWPDALCGVIRDADPDPSRKRVPISIHEPRETREWRFPVPPDRIGFGAHMILRRDSFISIGMFDERLGPGAPLKGAEDIDLLYRMLKGGYRVVTSTRIRVLHRAGPRGPRAFYGRNFGHAAFCVKHLAIGDRYALRLLARQLLLDLKMLASSLRRGSTVKARTAAWMLAGTWTGLLGGSRWYLRRA